MTPIGRLMAEHRLIERVIVLMDNALRRICETKKADTAFIARAVDFFESYTDRCHHRKEEDILFRTLAEKPLSPELRTTMSDLTQQHVSARGLIGQLLLDNNRCAAGESGATAVVLADIRQLVAFYPQHIQTEDKRFFPSALNCLTSAEQDEMLQRMADLDGKLIHERYRLLVEDLEKWPR